MYVNGVNLAYATAGAGYPVLFITGLSYGGWFWEQQVPAFADRFRVLTFDNRGSGQSDKPDLAYTAAMLADDTVGLMRGLGMTRAHIIGHSMGGFVAQELALRYPQQVDHLVLAATHFGGPNAVPIPREALAVILNREGDAETLYRRGIAVATAPDFAAAHPAVIDDIVRRRLADAQPAYAYQRQAGVSLAFRAEDRLGDIKAPTLILAGERDLVVPPANAALMAKKLPHAQRLIFQGAGHLFPLEQPERFNDVVLRFLGHGGQRMP